MRDFIVLIIAILLLFLSLKIEESSRSAGKEGDRMVSQGLELLQKAGGE